MSTHVAIYGRVSTANQADTGYGLDVQLQELRKSADEQGYNYTEYIDRGISGTDVEKRLGLQELLKDIQNKAIDEVWVTKLSRLGRNSRDVLNIIYEFEKYDVDFKSMRDGIDTSTNMGKIMLQFMAIIAEMERDVIIETTRAGADYRAKLGKIYGGPVMYGYKRVTVDNDTFLEVVPDEAETVKWIFDLFINGHGYRSIVTKLNRAGKRTKNGNMFQLSAVKFILTNPIYAGMIRYNYHKDWNKKRRNGKQSEYILVDGLHEAIIDRKTWDKVKHKIENNDYRKKPASGKFLLNGILKCPECGSGMVANYRYRKTKNGRTRISHYACGAHHNKGRQACKANLIKADVIEDMVLQAVGKYLKDGSLSTMLYDYIHKKATDKSALSNMINTLEDDIANVEDKVQRVKDLFEDGFIPKQELKKKLEKHNSTIDDLRQEKQNLLNKVENEEGISIDITKEEVEEIVHSLYETLSTSEDRLLVKELLRTIIKEIQVKNRLQPDMEVSLSFTEDLLKLFNKEVPEGIKFSLNQKV